MAEKFIPVIEKIHKKNDYEENLKILNDEISEDNNKFEQGKMMLEKEKILYSNLEKEESILEKEKEENHISQEEILKVSDEYRNSLRRKELNEKINTLNSELEILNKDKKNISDKTEELKIIIKKLESEKESIKEISQDEIINIEKSLIEKENILKNLELRKKEWEKITSDIKLLNNSIAEKKEKLYELENAEKTYTADRKNYFIHELEKELHEGDKCPVCNGIYHRHNSFTENISFNEEEFENIQKNIRTLKSSLEISEEKIKNYNTDLKNISAEISSINQIKNEINILKDKKENLNKLNQKTSHRYLILKKN